MLSPLVLAAALACEPPYLLCKEKDGLPLAGKQLRVRFLTESTDVFLRNEDGGRADTPDGTVANCTKDNTCGGLVIELYNEMRDWTGFTAVDTPPSPEAAAHQERVNSAWTACAYDVALGNVDLCISDTWDTAERRFLGIDFSTPYFEDKFNLYSKKHKARTLYTIFEPFTPSLWAVIIVVGIFLETSILAVEHPNAKKRQEFNTDMLQVASNSGHLTVDKLHAVVSSSVQAAAAAQSKPKSKPKKPVRRHSSLEDKLHDVEETVEEFARTFFLNEDPFGEQTRGKVTTIEGKSLRFVMKIFFFVVTACYTANLVTFLNKDAEGPVYRSAAEVEQQKLPVCVLSGAYTRLSNSNPNMMLVNKGSWLEIEAAFDAGECGAIVCGASDLLENFRPEFSCQFAAVTALYTVRSAFPVAPQFASLFSYFLQRNMESGKIEAMAQKYAKLSGCRRGVGSGGEEGEGEEDELQLGTSQLQAVIIGVAVITGLVLVSAYFKQWKLDQHRKKLAESRSFRVARAAADEEGEGNTVAANEVEGELAKIT